MRRNLIAFFLINILLQEGVSAQQDRPVSIYGSVVTYSEPDTVELHVVTYSINRSGLMPVPEKFIAIPRKGFFGGRAFKFEIPSAGRPFYISLRYGNKYLLYNYVAMPGDSVELVLDLNKYRTYFAGASAPAYKCQYELDLLDATISYERGGTLVTNNPENFLEKDNNRQQLQKDQEEFGVFGKVLKLAPDSLNWHIARLGEQLNNPLEPYLSLLDSYRAKLEPERYEMLKADIVGKVYGPAIYTYYNRIFAQAYSSKDNVQLKTAKDFFYEKVAPLPVDMVSEHAAELSVYYADFLINKVMAEAYVLEKVPVMELLKKYYSGRLLDKLVGRYLVDNYRYMTNGEKWVKDALQFVKVPEIHAALLKFDTNQSTGAQAYRFRLPNTNGDWVSMNDLKGRVVLVDFWYTGCMPCKWFGSQTLKTVKEHFKGRDDFKVLSVSIDRDIETWKKSVEDGEYTSKDAVNVYTMGDGEEHPMIRHYDVRGYPAVILIDRNGKIAKTTGLNTSAENLIPILEKQLQQ